MTATAPISDYTVELPSGGKLHLQTADEVELWQTAKRRYEEDYVLVKHNDLVNLGALLQQQIVIFRCQTAINGMEAVTDAQGVPTGSYRRIEMDGGDVAAYQRTLTEASKEAGRLEKLLGIDKGTREQGGAHTLENYIKHLKRAASDRGIHLTQQTLRYQEFVRELTWKLRILYSNDKQDRAYHGITPKSVLDWERDELVKLTELDKQFAREKGKLYIGTL